MNRRFSFSGLSGALTVIALLAGSAGLGAAEAPEPAPPVMAEGVPEVAVLRLRNSLGKTLPENEWRETALKLAQALIASARPDEALTLLGDARLRGSEAADFWRAQAMAALRRWNDALTLYETIAAREKSPWRPAALFGGGEALRALGRADDASAHFARLNNDPQWGGRARLRGAELFLERGDWANAQRLVEQMNATTLPERRERRYLRGRIFLLRDQPDKAVDAFTALVKRPEGASHSVVIGAVLGGADAHLRMKTPETGDDFVEDFIDRHPDDPSLALLFAKLDELYRAERKPARVELEKWTREAHQPRRAFAQWYLARIELRAGHRDRAAQLLGELRRSVPRLPAIAGALLEYGRLQAEDQRFEEAIAILNEARALSPEPRLLDQINLLAGEAQYAARHFDQAAGSFEQVANSNPQIASIAAFNAALGWLQQGDANRFKSQAKTLQAKVPDANAAADLRLEEGLVQAGKGENNATELLRKFTQEFPGSPRVSEAWVALAEIAFHAAPPRLDDARKFLERAAQSNPTPAAVERADYLTLWIDDATPDKGDKVIADAVQFLARHGNSPFAPDVRLKLAETYYRRQDFANAQTQFENLARQNPAGATAEKALFFAGQSAMSTMGPHSLDRAIELFDKVVQMKGELRWAARNEQAVIERKLGKAQEALTLYDEVLKNDARPGEKREALCGRGDIYFELGAADPANYERALSAYDQLAAASGESGHWLNQALFKKGVCLEKKADREGALVTFYRVLETPPRPDRPPEFFWFYKAGFNAARLLEDAAKWESAAAIYEKLAAAGGTRSEEAKARLSRLRLEHFLWGN